MHAVWDAVAPRITATFAGHLGLILSPVSSPPPCALLCEEDDDTVAMLSKKSVIILNSVVICYFCVELNRALNIMKIFV